MEIFSALSLMTYPPMLTYWVLYVEHVSQDCSILLYERGKPIDRLIMCLPRQVKNRLNFDENQLWLTFPAGKLIMIIIFYNQC